MFHFLKSSTLFYVVVIGGYLPITSGFIPGVTKTMPSATNEKIIHYYQQQQTLLRVPLFAKNSKKSDGEDEGNAESADDELVTKEMFFRNMLDLEEDDNNNDNKQEPQTGKVKRKKRNGSHYRVLDNRDSLPFLVKVTTPDPYTNNEIMKKQARKNTEQLAKGSKSKKNKNNAANKRRNLVGMDGVDSIASSIYKRKKDGSLDQVLGEFALDKCTNCGDILDVGDGVEYQVQKARCQYKYVGGKKFVMTRKILEVKEVKRILVEKEVKKLFENDGQNDDDDQFLQLE